MADVGSVTIVTAVIKRSHAEGNTIRAFDVPPNKGAREPTPAIDPLAVECARLRDEIAGLERRIAMAALEADTAIEAARAAGHAAGLAAADKRESERVKELAGSIAAQRAAVDARLDGVDGLAAALARRALAKLFDQPDAMAGMVTATIARHIDLLRTQVATTICVSGADFASPDAIAGLGDGAVTVEIDQSLASGACRIACRLGTIDLDVPGQWARLADALDHMAASA